MGTRRLRVSRQHGCENTRPTTAQRGALRPAGAFQKPGPRTVLANHRPTLAHRHRRKHSIVCHEHVQPELAPRHLEQLTQKPPRRLRRVRHTRQRAFAANRVRHHTCMPALKPVSLPHVAGYLRHDATSFLGGSDFEAEEAPLPSTPQPRVQGRGG